MPLEQLRGRFLPELLKTVDLIATALERQRRPAAPAVAPAPSRAGAEAVSTV